MNVGTALIASLTNFRNALRAGEPVERRFKVTCRKLPFKPHTYHDKDNGHIEIWVSDRPSYSKWVSPSVSLDIDEETGAIIGCTLSVPTGELK